MYTKRSPRFWRQSAYDNGNPAEMRDFSCDGGSFEPRVFSRSRGFTGVAVGSRPGCRRVTQRELGALNVTLCGRNRRSADAGPRDLRPPPAVGTSLKHRWVASASLRPRPKTCGYLRSSCRWSRWPSNCSRLASRTEPDSRASSRLAAGRAALGSVLDLQRWQQHSKRLSCSCAVVRK